MGDPVSTQLIVKAVSMGAQMALTATNRVEGPRLDSLKVSTASYGTPLEWFRGVVKLDGRPIIHAEDLHEKKETSKTKGGKYEEYKYDGTWAVAICSHPIAAVRRAWMDGKLVYQAKDIGPRAPVLNLFEGPGLIAKLGFRNFRLYLGGEDQEPDHRIEAFFLNRDGPGTTPAFRGTSYMMFEAVPLEKFGNRIPTVDIEAVTELEPEHPFEVVDQPMPGGLWSFTYSADFTKAFAGFSTSFAVWDIPTRTVISSGTTSFNFGSTQHVGLYNDGRVALPSGYLNLTMLGQDGQGETILAGVFGDYQEGDAFVVRDDGGSEFLATVPTYEDYYFGGAMISPFESTGVHWSPFQFVTDAYGDIWAIGSKDGSTSGTIYFHRIRGSNRELASSFFPVTGLTRPASPYERPSACHAEGGWLVSWGGTFYAVEDEGFTVTATAAATGGSSIVQAFRNHDSGRPTIWLYDTEWDILTATIKRTVDLGDWTAERGTTGIYDPINHAIISPFLQKASWLYLDRIGGPGVLLSTIAGDICSDCGIEDADTGALDQLVAGFKTMPGSGKDALGRLLEIYDSEVRPHGFGIQFIKRGAEPATTIDLSTFARSEGEKRYQASEVPDKNLPRRQTVSFADITKDHQTNTLVSQRPLASTDAKGVSPLDLGDLVATPDDAQRLADRRLRRVWVDRFGVSNALSWLHGAVEPGDAHFLNLGGVVRSVRLERQTFSNDRIACEWKFDFPGAAVLSDRAGPTMDNRDEQPVYVSGPTRGWVLDIPYLNDGEVALSPLLHFGAGDYDIAAPWAGADLYDADLDNNEFIAWQHVDPTQKATWGYCSGALSAADPWCWDRGSVLNVDMKGTLFAASEADILADAGLNQAVIGGENGWEVVQFADVTLEADGTYTLRNFLRGRRGTEGMVANHSNGETFILASSLLTDAAALDVVGLELDFKIASTGRSIAAAPVLSIDPFTGATLKPYAPAQVKKVYNGTDWTLTIVRRTRVGGRWVGGSAIPLSENSEAYQVEVFDGGSVVRTIDVSGTNVATYTAAEMIADFGAAQTSLTLRVYQLSDAVGRGFALAA